MDPPPQALIHFVCSRWPGSDGRKVAMRLLGKWFVPDIAWATGRPPPKPRPPLIAFAAPVPLTHGGAVPNPEIGHVVAWSQLLSLLAFVTRRQAVLPLYECAGILAATSRHAWVLSKPAAHGFAGKPRLAACAYRVGQGRWFFMPPALSDGTVPCVSLASPGAQAARMHPRAQPE